MGTVYRGWQLSVDREVAIKVIHPKLSRDRSIVKRFLREARLASRLSQPNIVNVYDFGQSEHALYLVMELLRGHALSSELGGGRRINLRRTAVIGGQLCDALEAAHAQGIIHRDLKPANIVILDDPPGRDLIKVLDFGLAKSFASDAEHSSVTATNAILGTPLYMAPEQIEGKANDQRTDLYALGCILYEMVSGAPPFVDPVVNAVLARHVGEAPPPLPVYVPGKLRALIEKLLAKNPDDRVQSAGDARKVLELVMDSPGMRANTPMPDMNTSDTEPDVANALAETYQATPVPGPAPVAALSAVRSGVTTTAKPRRYAVIAFFAIIPLGVLAFVMFTSNTTQPQGADSGRGRKGSATADVPDAMPMTSVVQGPPVDAAIPDAHVDAAIDAPPKPHGNTVQSHPPHARPDAGTDEPSIEFYPR
jgi:serine/threonine-protein kinase